MSPILNPPFCNKLITGQARNQSAMTTRPLSPRARPPQPSTRSTLCRDCPLREQRPGRAVSCQVRGSSWWSEGRRRRLPHSGAGGSWHFTASSSVLRTRARNALMRAFPGRSRLTRMLALLVLPTPRSLLLCLFLSSSSQRKHCSLHHQHPHIQHLLKLTLRLFQDSLALERENSVVSL